MKTLIIIPTYNEAENLEKLAGAISRLGVDCDILVVDDNSPDGTGDLADDLAKNNNRIKVIHRHCKLGLGTAYVAGFKYGLNCGYEAFLQMDCDFSHDPKKIPEFIAEIENRGADLVLGSRYLNGVSVVNWGLGRLLLSKSASLYVRMITGMPFSDMTGGFKCFGRAALNSIDLDRVSSNGYAFQIEMTYKAFHEGFKVKEIPIIFENRREGVSKMNKNIVIEALLMVWRLQLGYRVSQMKKFIQRVFRALVSRQFFKFAVVGGMGVIVNLGVFIFFSSIIGAHYLISAVFAFFAAVLFNFTVNKAWTFNDYTRENIFGKFIKYFLTNLGGLLVNLGFLFFLVRVFMVIPVIAQLAGIAAGTFVNFAGSKKLVFISGLKSKK